MAPEVLALFFGITFAAACLQGVVGFGFAMISVPLLSLVDSSLTPMPQLLAQAILLPLVYFPERSHARLADVKWTTLGRIPGTLGAALILGAVSQRTLEIAVGSLVLSAVLLATFAAKIPTTRTTQFTAGAASSAGAMLAAIGGPPLALLYRDAPGPVLRSTMSLIGLVGVVLALIVRPFAEPVTAEELKLCLWSLPVVLSALFVARRIKDKASPTFLRRAILGLSGASASALVIRALLAG